MIDFTRRASLGRWLPLLLIAPGYLVARWSFTLCALWPDVPLPWQLWPAALALSLGWLSLWDARDRQAPRAACLFSMPCALAQLIGRQYDLSLALGGPLIALQCAGCAVFLGLALAGPVAMALGWLARRPDTPPSAGGHDLRALILYIAVLMLL